MYWTINSCRVKRYVVWAGGWDQALSDHAHRDASRPWTLCILMCKHQLERPNPFLLPQFPRLMLYVQIKNSSYLEKWIPHNVKTAVGYILSQELKMSDTPCIHISITDVSLIRNYAWYPYALTHISDSIKLEMNSMLLEMLSIRFKL